MSPQTVEKAPRVGMVGGSILSGYMFPVNFIIFQTPWKFSGALLDSNWHSDRNSDSSNSITILRKDEHSATRHLFDRPSEVTNRSHAAFSCDVLNRWLAVGFQKDATEMFDLRTGQLVNRLKDPYGAHLIEFLRAGEVDRLATVGSGHVARVWDPISG